MVFYIDDLCNRLPFVYHKDNGRGYFDDEQKSIEAFAILDERKRGGGESKVKQKATSLTDWNKTDVRNLRLFCFNHVRN